MNSRRTARAFGVSVIVIVAVIVIPLVRCTSWQHGHAIPTAAQQEAMAARNCKPSSHRKGPTLCVDTAGNITPDDLDIDSQNGNAPVFIYFKAPDAKILELKPSTTTDPDNCKNIVFKGCGKDNDCRARTKWGDAGRCKYQAIVDGVAGPDPLIVTDTCCGLPPDAKSPKERQ